MKYFDWNKEKNEWLKKVRKVGFEDVIKALDDNRELARVPNPNKKSYPNQSMIIVNINNYAHLVPFVEDEEKIFLKTIIPSRKDTKKYLGGQK